jgi:hypothetical protein
MMSSARNSSSYHTRTSSSRGLTAAAQLAAARVSRIHVSPRTVSGHGLVWQGSRWSRCSPGHLLSLLHPRRPEPAAPSHT